MKERRIRIAVLAVVFVAALFVFSTVLNRGNTDMTANMGAPTLPTVSFQAGKSEVNLLAGHVKELPASSARNVVTPLDETGAVVLNLQTYDRKISSLSYTVYEKDGATISLEKTEKKVGETLKLTLGEALGEDGDGFLRIQLNIDHDQTLFYHTRIVRKPEAQFDACFSYVKSLHDDMLYGKNPDAIEDVLETSAQGDQTLQHVTIHSKLSHVTWGQLVPQVVGDVYYQIQETSEAYTAVQLQYSVTCNNEKDIYDVREFFKVRCSGEKKYLLAYDRTMTERFDGSKDSLSGKGIDLGMTSQDAQYQTNVDGTVVAFVQANELWSYRESENEFALVFSFGASEKEDIRNRFDDHSVRILSMNDVGDMTFAVYGYMNRGNHEGETGAAIYYFDIEKNVVKEIAFIPSNQPYVKMEQELGKLAYYNHGSNVLYTVAGNYLYEIDLVTGEQRAMLEHLEEGQYVSSEEGRYIAYKDPDNEGVITVLDFESGKMQKVQASADEVARPLGFIRGDFVCGIAKAADAGNTVSGESVLGMYKVEIRDEKNQVLKTYQADGNYILGAKFEANMIRLQCANKVNGVYQETMEDYISNNEEEAGNISLQSYWSEVQGTLYRLTFADGLKKRDAKVLKPKQVLYEKDLRIDREDIKSDEQYMVYGLGEILGVYEETGDALALAKEVSGIVVSEKQQYIWEADNRVAWYRNFEMPRVVMESGETALAACERVAQAYREGEKVRISGCSVAELRYLIDKGTAVVALIGNSEAVMLVGYDAKTVTYLDPHSGGARSAGFAKFNEMAGGSGQTYYAYVQ